MGLHVYKKIIFLTCLLFILLFAAKAKAEDINNSVSFVIDPNFDAIARSQVQAYFVKTSPGLYFYVEKSWWDNQTSEKRNEIMVNLSNVSAEFESNIYYNLTSKFGFEPRPGVDGDNRITVLFHAMREDVGGYFRSADGYFKIQVPSSNEKEMIYLPVGQIGSTKLKTLLAHEFMHLITFNQKDKIRDVQEDVWLNEARADYTSTILGYDNKYDGSNLQRRVRDFIGQPSNSLTEWKETKYDYSVVNLFVQYLVDHYGVVILSDSLKSKSVGIVSINEALNKNGFKENFSQIFTDWTIAMVVNDCTLSLKYCYLSNNLKSFKINPTINFLPLSGDSSLSVTNFTKNWAGNWQKIIGGDGYLKLSFSSLEGLNFRVPYIIFDKGDVNSIKFLKFDSEGKGEIQIEDFGVEHKSLMILPSLQSKVSGFESTEFSYPFTISTSITAKVTSEDQITIQKLLAQIDYLKNEIAKILAKKNGSLVSQNSGTCQELSNNLYFGLFGSSEVRCLQEFLKFQGQDIYPEGLITGNFGSLTKLAVIRFQEKYKNEILIPAGLLQGTGFVGSLTRAKINQILRSDS